MPRRGTWRPRKRKPSGAAVGGVDGATAEVVRPKEAVAAAKGSGSGGFFCCYLLRSLCPRLKGRTYIGFTVNPRRRIRQHNGEICSGAWRTRRGRPWEMVLCIHGFPTNVAALQFEWAWQHPKESLAVRNAASGFKSLSGAGNKVKLAYAMLNLPSWETMNLTVNFFSTASVKFAAGCPPLPSQMKAIMRPMEDLQCHVEATRGDLGLSSQEEDDIDEDHRVHQGPYALHGDELSGMQPSFNQEQPTDAQIGTAIFDAEEDNYSSDEFDLIERDGILDLTEPDGSRTSPQCAVSSNNDDGRSSQVDDINEDRQARESEHSWKQPSTDQVQQRMDVQTGTAVYDVEEDNFSSDEFVPMKWDGILDLTEPNGSRTSPQCSLSSGGDDDGVVEDEVGRVSPVWKVCGGLAYVCDGGVVVDGEPQQTSPLWKACAGSDSGVTEDELGQSSPMLVVDAGSEEEGERDTVVDLVTPTPVGRLRRRTGAGSICHRIIDLTASPIVMEL